MSVIHTKYNVPVLAVECKEKLNVGLVTIKIILIVNFLKIND